MNYIEFTETLKKQVESQDFTGQLQLAITICKEMYPWYERFFDEHRWGNPYLLKDALDTCEDVLEDPTAGEYVPQFIKQVREIIPDLDDFQDKLASYAFNASSSVYETLQFIQDEDCIRIFNIVACYIDTFDSQVKDNEELTEEELDNNPVIADVRKFLLESTK